MILDATAPHTRVDNFIIDEYLDKIGALGLGIYTVIKRHYNWTTGQCTPSYKRIAELAKVNRSTVIRYVKRFKAAGLIDPQMRFTDEGQTSNQYNFYQPKRPKKPTPKPAQKSTPAQMIPVVAESNPPGRTEQPDQVVLNKKEEKENTKTMPERPEKTEKTEKPAPKGKTEKQKQCPHPFAEVVTMFDGTTICNHCYDLLNFVPEAQAA